MRHCFLDLHGHEVHVLQWGVATAPAVMLVHGLARSCRDHDELAASLADQYQVLAVDMIGRGASSWAADAADYGWHRYLPIMAGVMDSFGVDRCAWIGTSMGAGLGIAAAGSPAIGPRLAALVLNDMGPEVPDAAFDAILSYASTPPVFDTLAAYEAFLRQTYAGRGAIADSVWRRLTVFGYRRRDDGRITVHNDPRVVEQIRSRRSDYQQWDTYDRLTVPTLCLRGAVSKLLLPDVAAAMTSRGPCATVIEIPGCGHAPGLDTDAQIGCVRRFLDQHRSAQGGWA